MRYIGIILGVIIGNTIFQIFGLRFFIIIAPLVLILFLIIWIDAIRKADKDFRLKLLHWSLAMIGSMLILCFLPEYLFTFREITFRLWLISFAIALGAGAIFLALFEKRIFPQV